MALLQWRDSLRLGVPAVDADHQRLVYSLNRLHFLDVSGDDRPVIASAVEDVLDYTREHFRREEMLMRLAAYPGYKAHCRIHRDMVMRAAELKRRFRDDPSGFTVVTFYNLIADWLIPHVLEEDVKMKPWIEKLDEANAA
ncbi:MAG: hemerythrin family protein [Rhodospirillales bacterium]|nr:hemerythrin family protein [Rhodospirillales bacterium]